MSVSLALLIVLTIAALAYVAAARRAVRFSAGLPPTAVHSRPQFHAWYAVLWTVIPALILLIVWTLAAPDVIEPMVAESIAAADRPASPADQALMMDEIRGLASGAISDSANPATTAAAKVYRNLEARSSGLAGGLAAALSLLGLVYAYQRLRPQLRARSQVERFVMLLLVSASVVAILTTFGILLSLIVESMRFFHKVPAGEFLFGLKWSPQTALRSDQVGSSGAFGAVPLFWGTLFIAAIAMTVAVPIGLFSAIYLTQYASRRWRSWLKPMLEVLAGVPTVVYGYFAAITLAPLIRNAAVALGVSSASSESALAAGLVMGVMIIPFVSSMADDAINAVPQAMKDGSLAMGATASETIRKVLIPAALPGIVGGFLLAASRAIGETMIVVMAAGLAANLTLNPLRSVTTVTAQIVQLLTGDQEFDSPKTLSAFALGLVLFGVTLLLNVYALRVVKKYREAYD